VIGSVGEILILKFLTIALMALFSAIIVYICKLDYSAFSIRRLA
jgi:hypothetical protein